MVWLPLCRCVRPPPLQNQSLLPPVQAGNHQQDPLKYVLGGVACMAAALGTVTAGVGDRVLPPRHGPQAAVPLSLPCLLLSVTNPIDVIKTRLQVQGELQKHSASIYAKDLECTCLCTQMVRPACASPPLGGLTVGVADRSGHGEGHCANRVNGGPAGSVQGHRAVPVARGELQVVPYRPPVPDRFTGCPRSDQWLCVVCAY